MTQVTHRGTWVPSIPSRSSAQAACFVRGVVAAGLGLGSFAVLVTVLWISSPHPDSGPGGALRVAAGLWLLAHGVELVRYDTLSGLPAPVGLTPMLLVVLPVWLVHRAARDAMDGGEGEEGGIRGYRVAGRVAFCGIAGGYVAVGAAAFLYAYGGPLPAGLVSTALHVPLLVAVAALAGVWTVGGRLWALPGWVPGGVREAVARPRFRVAVRAAGAGVSGLLGGGAVVALAALVWHAGAAQAAFFQLAGDWSGRFALALLVLALAPNAAVWGAAYGLGPGFALGAGATAAPLGVAGTPALPHFPLVAVLPAGGAAPAHWATLAVPVVAAGAVAWCTVRTAAPPFAVREESWSARDTAAAAALAGMGCGMGAAVLAALAGGPLGVGALAEFGPVWWLTGGAAAAWTVVLGVPAALVLRAWRLRDRTPWSWRRAVKEEREETVAAEAAGPAKRRWWRWGRPGSGEASFVSGNGEAAYVSGAAVGVKGAARGDEEAAGASGEAGGGDGEAADGVGKPAGGARRRWWRLGRGERRGRDGAAESGVGAASWWRSGGAGSDDDPYDGEADFLPVGDPDATVGADWHESGSREVRWAALKEASGGLMADFPAVVPGPQTERSPDREPPQPPPAPPAQPPPVTPAPPDDPPDGPS
ncbi:cell division protein PerM [Streptomyces chryseus]|uniref:cell division protein PerM n=2 Tax=Streptomyces chryseus TaxID=68186 RepID=UPI00167B9DA8|nr:DUF6350 family protein [Streptomyces chryseus]GGX04742.1 hypothetical protein GCM10010353_20470 [Streptomyces chryseus]